jgi:hypothetical protein
MFADCLCAFACLLGTGLEGGLELAVARILLGDLPA